MSTNFRPQDGPQVQFLSSPADIAIYGGAAGSGKSFALLLEPTRWARRVKDFAAVVFRRTTVQIRNPGALWDESVTVYGPDADATPTENHLEWKWKNGGKVKFAHLEYDKTVLDWHGAQVPLICFDELTTFTEAQFFYMLSRNRSTCGVAPYIRATCNPDADSWVAKFIAWWINQETGFPIKERSARIRWMLRVGNDIRWADTKEELAPELQGLPTHAPDGTLLDYRPMSVSFIAATINDNKELLKRDPGYLARLLALPTVERERLLAGNWKIRPAAGLYFKRSWIEVVKAVPARLTIKRGWDLAATEKTALNNPDWTVGTKMGRSVDKRFFVMHSIRDRLSPSGVERMIINTASQDGPQCEICLPQDPGQAGKAQVRYLARQLAGYPLKWSTEKGDKIERFRSFSSQAEAGNVFVLEGDWTEQWFSELEAFPDGTHDDDADSTSRVFNSFFTSSDGLLEYYMQEADELIKSKLAAAAGQEVPTLEDGTGVEVTGPPSVNMVYDLKGHPIFCDANGVFVLDPKHAKLLERSGFRPKK